MAASSNESASPPMPTREEWEALRRQVVELQRVSSLGVLAGSICHELNNALTPILSYAKLGLRNPDPEFRRRAFEKIHEGAERAAAITGGVLGLARPRADRRAAADLARLVEEVLMLTAKDLSKHRVKRRLPGRRPAPCPGQPGADPAGALEPGDQRPPGDARRRDGEGPRRPRRERPSGRGEHRRHRPGDRPGRPPADLRAVLHHQDRPRRDRPGRHRPGPLGLPGDRRGHRGRLRAESRVGRGTTFTLRLPACPTPAQQGAA